MEMFVLAAAECETVFFNAPECRNTAHQLGMLSVAEGARDEEGGSAQHQQDVVGTGEEPRAQAQGCDEAADRGLECHQKAEASERVTLQDPAVHGEGHLERAADAVPCPMHWCHTDRVQRPCTAAGSYGQGQGHSTPWA